MFNENQIKFIKAVNVAIQYHHVTFKVYRTVNKAVQAYELIMLDLNFKTGGIMVHIRKDGEGFAEPATDQDLLLISQLARQLSTTAKSR